jgi:hypothetical protein
MQFSHTSGKRTTGCHLLLSMRIKEETDYG